MAKKRIAAGPTVVEKLARAHQELAGGAILKDALERAGMTLHDYAYARVLTDKDELEAIGGRDHKSKAPQDKR